MVQTIFPEAQDHMILKKSVSLPRMPDSKPRRAYTYLPDGELDQRYPVLYMFDGHNVFYDEDATYGKSWGMLEYMEQTQTPLIIAAVECSHRPDHGRLSEYAPFTFDSPECGHIIGRGRATMQWMTRFFKPMIDRTFPTLPDRAHTFIAGNSMGGLMSLYALTAYNSVFSRAAALSPSLWTAPEQLIKLVRTARIVPNTTLYMDYGSEELSNHANTRRDFGRIAMQLMQRGVAVNSRIVPGGTHCEACWERQIPFFMQTLLYDLEQ